jgi:hypothetical protein
MVDSIGIREICEQGLSGFDIDIFFVVMQKQGISKKEILNIYNNHLGIQSPSSQKYRFKVDQALAILEALLFISSDREGIYKRYYMTSYGNSAKEILAELVDEGNMKIFRGSVIIKRNAME